MTAFAKSKRYRVGQVVLVRGKRHVITATSHDGIVARGKPVKS